MANLSSPPTRAGCVSVDRVPVRCRTRLFQSRPLCSRLTPRGTDRSQPTRCAGSFRADPATPGVRPRPPRDCISAACVGRKCPSAGQARPGLSLLRPPLLPQLLGSELLGSERLARPHVSPIRRVVPTSIPSQPMLTDVVALHRCRCTMPCSLGVRSRSRCCWGWVPTQRSRTRTVGPLRTLLSRKGPMPSCAVSLTLVPSVSAFPRCLFPSFSSKLGDSVLLQSHRGLSEVGAACCRSRDGVARPWKEVESQDVLV